MICTSPITIKDNEVPCGQCFECRINQGRKWSTRLQLEAKHHENCTFVTLSYNEENLPPFDELQKADLQDYIQTLRNNGMKKVRYFAAGEYGSKKGRSHYHLALYGPTIEQIAGTTDLWPQERGVATHADKYWKKGRVHLMELTSEKCGYITGYAAKKQDPKHELVIDGRNPEFRIMSKRPAIGEFAIRMFARHTAFFLRHQKNPAQEAYNQISWNGVRINGKIWPLDRHMQTCMARELEIPNAKAIAKEASDQQRIDKWMDEHEFSSDPEADKTAADLKKENNRQRTERKRKKFFEYKKYSEAF